VGEIINNLQEFCNTSSQINDLKGSRSRSKSLYKSSSLFSKPYPESSILVLGCYINNRLPIREKL